MRTMQEALGGATGFFLFRAGALAAGVMGVMGLILAVLGVYSVVSYAVAQRTREIGIRVALGATPRNIFKLILSQGVRLIVLGLLIGLLGAWEASRAVTRLLLGVAPGDPLTFCAMTALLAAIALAACYIPARRATKVDPMVALRYE